MAKKTVTIFTCDLCGKEIKTKEVTLPVRFTTEQTEGRPTKPYITIDKMDLCDDCLSKVTVITAHGAQGHNEYFVDRTKLKEQRK